MSTEMNCKNCGNKAIFIWWEPCKSCTPDKSNWKPKEKKEENNRLTLTKLFNYRNE